MIIFTALRLNKLYLYGMMPVNDLKKDLYYTIHHEWIEFHDTRAVVGITHFRLTGIKQIKKIEFLRIYGFKKRGEALANIQFDRGRIQVHIPVDGNIIAINDVNLLVDQNLLLNHPETSGWLVKILVSQPCEKKALISYDQFYKSTPPV